MNFPAAIIGVHFSNKKLLGITFFASGILSFMTPLLIQFQYRGSNELFRLWCDVGGLGNWRALVVLRVIQGMLQVLIYALLQKNRDTILIPQKNEKVGTDIFEKYLMYITKKKKQKTKL